MFQFTSQLGYEPCLLMSKKYEALLVDHQLDPETYGAHNLSALPQCRLNLISKGSSRRTPFELYLARAEVMRSPAAVVRAPA